MNSYGKVTMTLFRPPPSLIHKMLIKFFFTLPLVPSYQLWLKINHLSYSDLFQYLCELGLNWRPQLEALTKRPELEALNLVS